MSKDVYTAPVIEEVKVEKPAPETTDQETKPANKPTTNNTISPNINQKAVVPDVINIAAMVSANGNAVSDLMIKRIERHFAFLKGTKGFSTEHERVTEQVSFVETIANSVKLDFDKYALVTDYLYNQLRENPEVVTQGKIFKFLRGADRNYSSIGIERYKSYMNLLIKLATNHADRRRQFKLIDINYATKDLKEKARDNINTYFRKLVS